jgi:hypothetical protein
MKIQLDTKALERLIGGESEIEVELRNSVVQEFAKKHLKPLVNSSTLGKVMEEFKTIITAEIKAMLPVEWKRDGWNSNIKYNWKNTAEAQDFRTCLYGEAKAIAEQAFRAVLADHVEEFKRYAVKEFRTKTNALINELGLETLIRKVAREEVSKVQFTANLPEK